MGKTLVELSIGIFVYGEYELVDKNGEKMITISSFDVLEGWFEAKSNGKVERYFMKDYGITPVLRDVTWEPENSERRMFLLRD